MALDCKETKKRSGNSRKLCMVLDTSNSPEEAAIYDGLGSMTSTVENFFCRSSLLAFGYGLGQFKSVGSGTGLFLDPQLLLLMEGL